MSPIEIADDQPQMLDAKALALSYQTLAPTAAKADKMVDDRLKAPFIADANEFIYQWEASHDYNASAGLEADRHLTTGDAKFYKQQLQDLLQTVRKRRCSSIWAAAAVRRKRTVRLLRRYDVQRPYRVSSATKARPA